MSSFEVQISGRSVGGGAHKDCVEHLTPGIRSQSDPAWTVGVVDSAVLGVRVNSKGWWVLLALKVKGPFCGLPRLRQAAA